MRGRCSGSTVVQMSGLMEALFDGRSPILERSALRDASAEGERRFWLLRELQRMLERAADDAPLLICLDDMQWADSGTASCASHIWYHRWLTGKSVRAALSRPLVAGLG